ncbi:Pycsar system effector family protein [Streptomyces sp. NPDC088752]|uniref:Pycsar system effector family protein n=1 Tax=Streptomyces sp. NPDC088752 TaxID=3154963 RepID=UPI00344584AB
MTETPSSQTPQQVPNADHAWKALALVVDWIKHAETKAGVTLAAAGVASGVLYNLLKDATTPSTWLLLCSILSALGLVATGLCAGCALWPRLRMKEEPTSLLYFHHIARGHPKSDTYTTSLISLTADIDALVGEIASQGWANSKVAHKKYMWSGWAIRSLILSLITLAATAGLRVID